MGSIVGETVSASASDAAAIRASRSPGVVEPRELVAEVCGAHVLCREDVGVAERVARVDHVLAAHPRRLAEHPAGESTERPEDVLVGPTELGLRVRVAQLVEHRDVLAVREPDLAQLVACVVFAGRVVRPVVDPQVREQVLGELGAEDGDVVADAAVGNGRDLRGRADRSPRDAPRA